MRVKEKILAPTKGKITFVKLPKSEEIYGYGEVPEIPTLVPLEYGERVFEIEIESCE